MGPAGRNFLSVKNYKEVLKLLGGCFTLCTPCFSMLVEKKEL
jgi:hypothetical protein